ncbi:MAG: cytochrome P450 [Solirubrobacterales bacterium]
MSASLPPGPRYPAPIQGVGFWTRPLPYLERCRARYGKRFTLRLPSTPPFVMLTTPEEIKGIFTAPPDVLHPGEGARTLEPIVGRNSVILLDGDSHMEQRKLMLPAFHGERMKRLEGLVAAVTQREVASWGPEPSVELHPRMQGLTLEVILRAVFGLDPGERLDALRARLGAMLAYGESPMTLFINPSPRMERLFNRFGPMAGFVDLREEVDRLVFELVDERRDAHEERDDVLSMLLEARHEDGSPMSDQELRDELMTLLVAGHETTASSLAWAFERLVRDPAVLGTLVSEIDSGDGDAYVTATIQETLRRRPVLPTAAPRLIKKPIEVGGWEYEPGACLVPCSYLLHHDPEVYPDPYAFRPERFLDSAPGTYTWTPFGGGRRRCLGAGFALLEMRIVLASVLRSYELRPGGERPELAERRNITITPGGGTRVSTGVRTPAAEPALA